jgi:hypothetical protein
MPQPIWRRQRALKQYLQRAGLVRRWRTFSLHSASVSRHQSICRRQLPARGAGTDYRRYQLPVPARIARRPSSIAPAEALEAIARNQQPKPIAQERLLSPADAPQRH